MHEGVSIVDPLEFLKTNLDGAVEELEMLLEELLLLITDQVHDVIIIPHDQHHVLLEDAQLLTALVQLRQVDVQVDKAVLLHLIPVVDLNENLAQIKVKVALEEANLARLREERVLAKEGRLCIEEHLICLDEDEVRETIVDFLLVCVYSLNLFTPFLVEASLDEVVKHLLELLVLGLGIVA